MKKRFITIVMLLIVVVLAVISFFVLPDTVITQISIGSSSVTTMPKLYAVALPTAVGILGFVVQRSDKENKFKGSFILAVAILIEIIMLVVNL